MSIGINLHTKHGLETYAQGMCNSSGDKAQINQDIKPGTILELGCGNGAYLQTLPDDRLKETTAVDMSAALLLKAQENLGERAGLVTFKRANMLRDNFTGLFNETFDNIVLCSVLHELYSELRTQELVAKNDEFQAEYNANKQLKFVFDNIWNLLSVGGRLIIRDGCKAQGERVTIKFKNPETRYAFAKFVDDHPWFISYSEHDYSVTLNMQDAYEFMTKYFYTENWDIEVLERFGWCDYQGIVNILSNSQFSRKQFKTIRNKPYLIEWLANKWNQDIELDKPLPASTMIVVLEKIS